MKEKVLAYIWMSRMFIPGILHTVNGDNVEIINSGTPNNDAGPDIFNAMIKINGTLWAGNVEFHVRSSDWYHHGHHLDPAYDNIILHVVFESDTDVRRPDKTKIPELELKGKIQSGFLEKYHFLMNNKKWIPCENLIGETSSLLATSAAETMLVERFTRKAESILQLMEAHKLSWSEILYRSLASNFGFKLNGIAFEMLASSVPLKYAARIRNEHSMIEALYFGQSGLLESDCADDYHKQLLKDYRFLQRKFNLKPMDGHIWKFLRTRPGNFPTIRISQFAHLVFRSENLFARLIGSANIKEIKDLFDVEVSEYWKNHWTFGKESKRQDKILGESSRENIIVNTVLPFYFAYSKAKADTRYSLRALDFCEKLKGEKNHITTHWENLGLPVKSMFFTQGLIELKNRYCARRRCLECRIGNSILRNPVAKSQDNY
ncbi:MAG: DUF2851 family protein [Bacteroidetes bacterium]|nr:DUF2851 family protein [Bacteroidota bacterium]MBU1717557.1 DUF2851 family protein [Bacteroidota bacterium]